MEILRSYREGPVPAPPSVVTIGNFDGVHAGHVEILRRLVARARRDKLRATVLTFDPHPLVVLAREAAPGLIMPIWRRCTRIEELGVDAILVQPFDAAFAALDPSSFVEDVLRGGLGARVVVVGAGFRFGAGRAGEIDALSRGDFGPMDVEVVPPVLQSGEPVSSSRIRAALQRGDIEQATALLGRPYELIGRVVRGDGRGRLLGFPTANLRAENGVLPADGVYAGVTQEGRAAVVNIGVRPTFGAGRAVEVHVIDFSGNLYDRTLGLAILARVRDERKFSSAAELEAQIKQDVARARQIVGGT
ncbi:MAG: bifunctional riboflavin kinase/FAD synthetase [Deltaproteobacteria bacterium]|nr:bifunctional riboflavin kinase/FAD synthetase [Deltaproteobacteria bacterium]